METASPALAPPAGHPRFELFDGLRGIAVCGVMLVHLFSIGSGPQQGRWVSVWSELSAAVQVFFAVSGFLLYRPYVAARVQGRPAPTLHGYLRRRVLRIVPGYWVALTLSALIFSGSVNGVLGPRWWLYYGFGQSFAPAGTGLAQGWTLTVEAMFYLALPLIAWGTAWLDRRAQGTRGGLALIAALAGIGLTGHALCAAGVLGWTVSETLLAQFQFLAIGMALATLSVTSGSRPPRPLAALARHPALAFGMTGASLLVAGLGFGYHTPTSVPVLHQLGNDLFRGVAVGCLLVPAVFPGPRRGIRRVLASRAAIGLGVISYGVYLWHVQLIVALVQVDPLHPSHDMSVFHPQLLGSATLTVALVTVPASLLLGVASYRWVEMPFLRRKPAGADRITPPGPAGAAEPA